MPANRVVYFAYPRSLTHLDAYVVILKALVMRGYTVVDQAPRDTKDMRAIIKACDMCVFTTFPKYQEAVGIPNGTKPRVAAETAADVEAFMQHTKPVVWVSPEFTAPENVEFVVFKPRAIALWRKFIRLRSSQSKKLEHAYGMNGNDKKGTRRV